VYLQAKSKLKAYPIGAYQFKIGINFAVILGLTHCTAISAFCELKIVENNF